MTLRGLYAITPDLPHRPMAFEAMVAAALRGGARIVQYRDKTDDAARRSDEARQCRALCDAVGALFMVNDDIELALHAAADGIHLGRDDAPVEAARVALGDDARIGVSCYDSLERARDAVAMGADYVAFGAFFSSPTKPDAARAHTGLIVEAKSALGVPVCAIGGITPANARVLVDAGADMLAVISGLFAVEDVEAQARRYAQVIKAWALP